MEITHLTHLLDWDIVEEILDTLDCNQRREPAVVPVRDAILDQLPQDHPDTFTIRLPITMWQLVDRLCPEVEFIVAVPCCELTPE